MQTSESANRFLVDRMLVRLGKYLRIAGCDAAWDLSLPTHELILRANGEGRVFLTRNRHLPDNHPRPDRWVLLESDDPVAQFQSLVSTLGLDTASGLFRNCIRCNLPLLDVADKAEIQTRVHPNVYARHDAFHRCPSCGTVFWKGSHVRNTCAKLGLPLPADTRG